MLNMNNTTFETMNAISTNEILLNDVLYILKRNITILKDVKLVGDGSTILFILGDEVEHCVGSEGIRQEDFLTVSFPTRHAARRVMSALATGTLGDLVRGAERAKETIPQEMQEEWRCDDDYEDEF